MTLTEAQKIKARHLIRKIQDSAIETINYHPDSRYSVEPIVTYAKQLKDLLQTDE